ncbi:hypothetical protein ACHAWF_013923 [Thalassiosira exigua]
MTAGPKSPIASANAAVPHDARTPPGTPSHGVSDGIDGHSRKPRFCRRGAALCVTACVLFGITSLCHHALKSGGIHEDFVRNIPSSYARPPRQGVRTGRANDFVVHFRHALRYNMTSPVPTWQSLFSSQQLPPSNPTVKTQQHAVPFLLKDGKLLCRRAHISMLSGPNRIPILSRSKALVEMIRAGLDRQKEGTHFSHELSIGLPFLVMNGDHSGCDPALKSDRFHFPRLAWSYPSPEIVPGDWCKTIPAPSYVSWRDFKGKESETGWSNEFSSLSEKYPWSGKLDKAVWRGSTTAYGGPFGGKTVNETPRGQLVRIGTENPELFDVGFTRMNSRFAPQNDTQIALAAPLPFNDFMKYKAILDIDGNDWSSRFPMVRLSLSVIVCTVPIILKTCLPM